MKTKLPLMEDVTRETLLEIAGRRFPECKSYKRTYLNGKAVCINKNALFRAVVIVKHNKKKNETSINVFPGVTLLGSLLVGPLWGQFIFKKFFDEVEDVYLEELYQKAESL